MNWLLLPDTVALCTINTIISYFSVGYFTLSINQRLSFHEAHLKPRYAVQNLKLEELQYFSSIAKPRRCST